MTTHETRSPAGLILPTYGRDADSHPELNTPEYRSSALRYPKQPLQYLPQYLTEVTGPLLGQERCGEHDHDLTVQHNGEPLGERIIVSGRVLDSGGKPVPNTLVEIWQANSSGRYLHQGDRHPAPLDPNFSGTGRCTTVEIWQADEQGRFDHPDDPRPESSGWQGFGRCPTDADGGFWFRTVKPGPLPTPDGATEAPHIDVTVLTRGMLNRVVTRVYFPDEEQANAADPVLSAVDPARRATLVAATDDRGYRFDIRLQGDDETVFFAL
ncbi:protocatechuate 3,4-dioxygenase subunit alpha [Saccharopolyspora sp. ASAGF58]|uniref:protocatechuate 3,4-dioxygenase subunit alpha n=1 Tax=Saccharopolyspora sp. ASAGF58 TaxID=2719023 RepID=UPI00143FEC94|nr:protocatechuate 3,4-dioxygenase subunit alpha [Saccharopolyspora sp. ASAGF58]